MRLTVIGQILSVDQRPGARNVNVSSGAIAGFTGLASVLDGAAGLYDFAIFDVIFGTLSLLPIWFNRAGRTRLAAAFLLILAHAGALWVSPLPGAKEPEESVYGVLLLLTFIVLYHRSCVLQIAGLIAVLVSYFLIQPILIAADIKPRVNLTPWQISYAHVVLAMGCFFVASLVLSAVFRGHSEARRDAHRSRAGVQLNNQATGQLARSQFLSVISHEIRNPLTTINWLSEALEKESTLGHTARKTLRSIRSSTEFLASLLAELLDLSRLEAGAARLSVTPFSPRQQIEDAAAPFAAVAAAKNLGFHVEVDAELPAHVVGDPLRLTQILTNLCTNAVKFTARGRITVSASSKG